MQYYGQKTGVLLHLYFKTPVMSFNIKYYLFIYLLFLLLSCKETQNSGSDSRKVQDTAAAQGAETAAAEGETYFSIKGYFTDQWRYKRGDPYTLLKLVYGTAGTDSTYVVLDSTLWFSLCSRFNAADISAPAFLGKYRFDMFEDRGTEMTYLHYEAKTPELFLQKMDIAANIYNNMVRTIYLETKKEDGSGLVTQKLQYIPDRSFQIQEYVKRPGAAAQNMHVEYLFKY